MHTPPKFSYFILWIVTHDVHRPAVLGDLHETYLNLLDHYGRQEANRWYRSQMIRSLPFLFHRSVFWGFTMFRNYLRVAFRTIRKHKGYSLINVSGLAAGLACFFFISLFIQHERSYDAFHTNADNIYRLELNLVTPSGLNELATSPGALSPLVSESIADIAASTRLFRPSQITVTIGQETYKESSLLFVDHSVQEVFDFNFLSGDPSGLSRPDGAIVTTAAANKYFGTEDVVGETIIVSDSLVVDITGVVKTYPTNSHFQFGVLVSMDTWKRAMPTIDARWSPHMFHTYARLVADADVEVVDAAVQRLVDESVQLSDGWNFRFLFTPLTGIHLTSHKTAELDVNGSADTLYIFGVVALFILGIACINFMNLSTARSSMRIREIGMRKVLGARRAQLVGQFMGEAFLFSLLSMSLGILIVIAGMSVFNSIADTSFTGASLVTSSFLGSVLLATIMVGLVAGSYPSLFLSSFRPLSVLKGWFSSGTAGRKGSTLRKGLVIFQFTVSIFLIAGTGVVLDQLAFMRSHDKGFNEEQVLVLGSLSARELGSARTFKERILEMAAVENVTMSNAVPGRETITYSYRVPTMTADEWNGIPVLFTDADFVKVFDVEMAAGRDFSWEHVSDSSGSIILNEAAVADVGWTPDTAIGQEFSLTRGSSTIVGVVRDFNYNSLHETVGPMAIVSNPVAYGSAPLLLSVRLTTAEISRAVSDLRLIWKEMMPNRPFDYFFLDEDYDKQYQAEERLAGIFTAFGGLAILIACLGLFGLATLAAEEKTKEIGIRKTLGASARGIVGMFTADFMKLVAAAILIGIPITWIAASSWLDGFAYRTGLGVGVFLFSAVLLGLLATATIAIQSVRVATANPVDALRHE